MFKNIQTTDWEYQALQSLARRYDCTHQWQQSNNNSSITRFEFAVGLNSCLQQIENITSGQYLIVLQRLRRDFASELARLTNEIEQLETKVSQNTSKLYTVLKLMISLKLPLELLLFLIPILMMAILSG